MPEDRLEGKLPVVSIFLLTVRTQVGPASLPMQAAIQPVSRSAEARDLFAEISTEHIYSLQRSQVKVREAVTLPTLSQPPAPPFDWLTRIGRLQPQDTEGTLYAADYDRQVESLKESSRWV